MYTAYIFIPYKYYYSNVCLYYKPKVSAVTCWSRLYDANEDHSDANEHHDDANDATEDVTVDEVGNSSEILRNLSLASTNSTAAGHLASRLFQGNTFTMV